MRDILPVEYGKRIKRARQAKNLTQKQLALLANLSDSAISKYETQGTLDVNVLNHLSEVLGISLFSSSADAEGTVGIIGKEILTVLVLRGGFIDVSVLNEDYMHGMDEDTVTNEIIKLSELGMVVREPYEDFDGCLMDALFIRAKGLIAYKNAMRNIDMTDEMKTMISKTKTYEQITEGYEYYQDYLDAHELEKLIAKLEYVGTYRIDYIIYLKRKYQVNIVSENDFRNLEKLERLIPAKSFYHDLVYRMAFGLTNDLLWRIIDSGILTGTWKYENEYKHLLNLKDKIETHSTIHRDPIAQRALKDMLSLLPEWYKGFEDYVEHSLYWEGGIEKINEEFAIFNRYLINPNGEYCYEWQHVSFDQKRFLELKAEYEKLEKPIKLNNGINFGYHDYLEDRFYEVCQQKGDIEPWLDVWYSPEEQIEFVKENFPAAKTKEERELDRKLREINKMCPETLDYYLMPNIVEKSGLAELVRETYKIVKNDNAN